MKVCFLEISFFFAFIRCTVLMIGSVRIRSRTLLEALGGGGGGGCANVTKVFVAERQREKNMIDRVDVLSQ